MTAIHRSPLGPLGRIVDRLVLGRYMRSLLVTRNASLKYEAEIPVTPLPAQARLLVLYDADCGICSRSARLLRRLDHGRRLYLMPLQDAGEIVGGPPAEVLLDAMHVRDGRGRWTVAGAAWIKIAEEIPLLRPLAIAGRLGLVRSFVEWAYGQVAGNRHRISRLLGDDACPIGRRTQ